MNYCSHLKYKYENKEIIRNIFSIPFMGHRTKRILNGE